MSRNKLMYIEKHLELGFEKPDFGSLGVAPSGVRPRVSRNALREPQSPFFAHGLPANILRRRPASDASQLGAGIARDAPTPEGKLGHVRS